MLSTFTNPDYASLGLDRQEWEYYYGLLRGDSNAAMFTQFDTNPGASTVTILNSDNVANDQRDGQDATYYLDLDLYAVSGSFDVDLDVPDDYGQTNTVTLNIQPVYYPGGGPVDPDKTLKAIQAALAAAPNLGLNWPNPPYLGAVNVQLVNNPVNPNDTNLSGNFAEQLGSPWDPSATPSTAPSTSTRSLSKAKRTTGRSA